VDETAVEQFVVDRIEGLAKLVSTGPHGRGVPELVRLDAVRRLSGLDQVASFLCGAQLRTLADLDEKTRAVIREL